MENNINNVDDSINKIKDSTNDIIEEYTPKLFSEEQNFQEETNEMQDDNRSDQLFDQDTNEEEDFEIPAFLRKQKF